MAANASDNSKGPEPDSTNKIHTETEETKEDALNNENVTAASTPPSKTDGGGGLGGGSGGGNGAGRKRKRHLFNSIRTQMEFYFGDANLSKDRFLRRFVEQDPFVPLDIFLTFNKIKTLTEDVQQISRSLSNSQLLELDESGLKVRRRTELPSQRDVNEKTLYVEALPSTATHDWLKDVFSRYGTVAYVSLPHYPGTRKIKEFAFIEFEKSASVEKAVKAFGHVQGVLSAETNPAELASIRSFQQQQQKTAPQSQQAQQEAASEITVGHKREADKELQLQDSVPAKRVKLELDQQQHSEASSVETTDAESEADIKNGEQKQQEDPPNPEQQKKRRRKQKKRLLLDKHKPNIEPSALDLKVLPKTSWCSLRNKYLNLQRRMINEAKSKLWRSTREPQPNQQQLHAQHQQQQQLLLLAEAKSSSCNSGASSGHESTEPLSDANDAVELPVPSKRRRRHKSADVHKMNMNFYGAGGGEADDSKILAKCEDPAQERSPLFKYEPGLIVECALLEPCTNVKDFKADMRQYQDIKYIDIKEGEQLANLRMATPTAAEDLVRQLNCAELQMQVLRGQPELKYWRKIEQDREAKLTKNVRVQQKRGREKVIKILAKHIKFDDADDDIIAPVSANNDPPSSIPSDT